MSRSYGNSAGCPSGRACGVCQNNRQFMRRLDPREEIEEQVSSALHPEEIRLIECDAGLCDCAQLTRGY